MSPDETSSRRRLAAVWFADIVGYTTLAASDELAALEHIDRLQAVAREVAAECGGRIVKSLGDAVLAEFSSTEAAVRAALLLRERYSRDVTEAASDRLRIGIHVGDVVAAPDGDVYGDGVNVAARLQRECEPGEVLVSGDVWRQLRQRSDYRFTPRGERTLRGLVEPIEVFEVGRADAPVPPAERRPAARVSAGPARRVGILAAGIARPRRALAVGALLVLAAVAVWLAWRSRGEGPAGTAVVAPEREVAEASIAVLPFDNMSPDPENEYFADGLAEEVLNALANVPGLRVAARTSSFSFKDRDVDIPTIAEALGVRTVLEGSVRKSGDRVRITAQLVNAEDGLHLWSETYDRDLDDIFAVQEEIARSIVEALEVRLAAGGTLVERPTESQEAYEEYLRGRFLWNQRTEVSLQASIDRFQRAVALDPEFALAWAGLADVHLTLQWYVADADWDGLLERGREAAERALEIDPELGQAHVALGLYEASKFRWEAADEKFQRGLELSPRYDTGHYWYAFTIAPQGRFDEALEHARIAAELDPLSLVNVRGYGTIFLWAGRYNEALAQLDRVRELDRNFAPVWGTYAQVYSILGQWPEATAAFVRRAELRGWDPEAARRVMAAMERHARERRPLPIPSDIDHGGFGAGGAAVAAMLGQPDSAMASLQRMYDDGNPNLREAGVAPWLAPLHDDPRFVALLERIGLAPVESARAWMKDR